MRTVSAPRGRLHSVSQHLHCLKLNFVTQISSEYVKLFKDIMCTFIWLAVSLVNGKQAVKEQISLCSSEATDL